MNARERRARRGNLVLLPPLRDVPAAIFALLVVLITAAPKTAPAADSGAATFSYAVPLDARSPWPKFRRNAVQNGRSPVEPVDSGGAPWTFHTGKGVFSTAVIDGDGNVYIGSADCYFYAIDSSGQMKWKFLTGKIIDSSALLSRRR